MQRKGGEINIRCDLSQWVGLEGKKGFESTYVGEGIGRSGVVFQL